MPCHHLRALLALLFVCHQGGSMGEKIEGGHEAKAHSRPYMVYIVIQDPGENKSSCDGFLVSDDFVMTAAHCKREKMYVFTGIQNRASLTNEAMIHVDQKHAHPHYRAESLTHAHDIMLLKLRHKAVLNDWVKLLKLPQSVNESLPTTNCLVPGWGITSFPNGTRPKMLQEVNVTVDSSIQCGTHKICSQGSKGPLKGDSGGPIICGDVAYGVVSSYVPTTLTHYYTNISHYHHWIKKTMAINRSSERPTKRLS
ncbi:mast cell protease 1A [Engraulis encrasicolus]|uniref:mast cell protease 1A n=1 Tax=Engraulis encrasicolus TaxID=184585 RepID=UPI002FD3F7DD